MTGLLAALQRPVVNPTCDQYLRQILARERVFDGLLSPVTQAYSVIGPLISNWGGDYVSFVAPSGSHAKGTANASRSDLDILISLRSDCSIPLGQICSSLRDHLSRHGYPAKLQNVSVGTTFGALEVDLVPARQHSVLSSDHSLYNKRTGTWKKTNLYQQVQAVMSSGRIEEIRLLKLWRDQRHLDFPSFFLELSVIKALAGIYNGTLSGNMLTVFDYLVNEFYAARIIDPGNQSNIISDDLKQGEKTRISVAANLSLMTNWHGIVR